RHERTAVTEVEPDPVPARCLGRQILARPFVIEPRRTLYALPLPAPVYGSRHREMRTAVVVARLCRDWAFATEARFALEQDRLRWRELEIERQLARVDPR